MTSTLRLRPTTPSLRLRVARGVSGEDGVDGAAATIAAGTTTTSAEGTSASVANSGTSAAATFDFTIPRGAIPAVGFNFNTATTDSDKDAGDCWFNNATPASVTVIYFDNADRDGNTVLTWLDTFDDSTATVKGTLTATPAATPSAKLIYNVTGSVTDGTGYRKVAVAHVAGATLPSDNAHLGWSFSRTGNNGTDGEMAGPGVSVDGEIALYNGITGATLKRANQTGILRATSGVLGAYPATGADANVVTGTAGTNGNLSQWNADGDLVDGPSATNPQFTTIELGHATDTTVSRSAAGVIAVEGLPLYPGIPQNSQSAAYTLVLSDAQKHIFHPSADTTARTWTIPANSSVAFPIGTCVTFINQNGAGVITIAITTDTMRLAGAGSTGSRTLAANGVATAVKVTSTEWIISGTGLT